MNALAGVDTTACKGLHVKVSGHPNLQRTGLVDSEGAEQGRAKRTSSISLRRSAQPLGIRSYSNMLRLKQANNQHLHPRPPPRCSVLSSPDTNGIGKMRTHGSGVQRASLGDCPGTCGAANVSPITSHTNYALTGFGVAYDEAICYRTPGVMCALVQLVELRTHFRGQAIHKLLGVHIAAEDRHAL